MTARLEKTEEAQREFLLMLNGVEIDPFDDDEEIVAACDLENPESCESCT